MRDHNGTPDLIEDTEIRRSTQLSILATDWTSRHMRPDTVIAALMQAGPGDPLLESVDEMSGLHDAVAYAAQCMSAEDTYFLNCIDSEGITFDELGSRMSFSRSRAWRLYTRAKHRLRTLLLNHPPVRERLGMEPTWNAAAMEQLVAIASYEDDWGDDMPAYTAKDASSDIHETVRWAVAFGNDQKEKLAVDHLTYAAEYAVAYLRSVGKWNLLDMHTLLCSKQNDYGHGNILTFGMTGVLVRCSDKAERLKNLTNLEGLKARNESLLDTFVDVVGYAVIARMLKAETFELALDNTKDAA